MNEAEAQALLCPCKCHSWEYSEVPATECDGSCYINGVMLT